MCKGYQEMLPRKWVAKISSQNCWTQTSRRLVGREVKNYRRFDLFSAAPPFGDIKVLVFHVCKRSDRTRAAPLCRHRHQAYVLLRACTKTDLYRDPRRGVGQQRQQISELQCDNFLTPSTFICWKIRFKDQVTT